MKNFFYCFNILISVPLVSPDILDNVSFSLNLDEFMKNELGFDPFVEHQPNSREYRNGFLDELKKGFMTRRHLQDFKINQPNVHRFKKRPSPHEERQDASRMNSSQIQEAMMFKRDLAKLNMLLNQRHTGIDTIKNHVDDFKFIADFLDKMEPNTRRFGTNEEKKTEEFLQNLENIFFDTRSTMQKYLRTNWFTPYAYANPNSGYFTNYANDVFFYHNRSWMAVTRRAKQLMLTAMHSWVYRTRFNFIYAQKLRWRMVDTIRYQLGFCFSLLRSLVWNQMQLYQLFRRFYNNKWTFYYHHAHHYVLRIFEKIHRLYLDARDVVDYIKVLEAWRKLDEAPNFYDFFQSSKSPLWGRPAWLELQRPIFYDYAQYYNEHDSRGFF